MENDQSAQKSVTVKTLEHRPSLSAYVVRGKVQYRDVEGIAYIEMWNIMPDGNRFFSRTVENYGKARKIQGSSDWREFELPAFLKPLKPESVMLEINVVMPGKGTIELSELTISDLRIPPWWFSNHAGGILGGVLGTIMGLYGAVTDCLCGFLVPRGKGRRLIFGIMISWIIVGTMTLVAGLSALFLGQPYHAWYSLVLTGGITTILFPHSIPGIKKAYAQAELRKMQALDA